MARPASARSAGRATASLLQLVILGSILITATLVITNFLRVTLPRVPYMPACLPETKKLMLQCELEPRLNLKFTLDLNPKFKFKLKLKLKLKLKVILSLKRNRQLISTMSTGYFLGGSSAPPFHPPPLKIVCLSTVASI